MGHAYAIRSFKPDLKRRPYPRDFREAEFRARRHHGFAFRAVLWVTLLLVTAETSAGAAESPTQRVHQLLAAINAHDMAATMGHFHEDFTLRHDASSFQADRAGLRRLLEWDFAMHVSVEVETIEPEGEDVTARLREVNDFYRLLGLGPERLRVRYRFAEDGRIVEQTFAVLHEEGPTLKETLAPVLKWAAEHWGEEELSRLYDGGVIATGDTAKDWVALLREWRDARKANPDSDP